MTNDLVKRLRLRMISDHTSWEAASHIEELEKRIKTLAAALDDLAQYVPRSDWSYVKPETKTALDGKE